MAVVALSTLYCLGITLSTGENKTFALDPQRDKTFMTPSTCAFDSDFWIKSPEDISFGKRLNSPFDFHHRTFFSTSRPEWSIRYYGNLVMPSTRPNIAINGKPTQPSLIGLQKGDIIQLKYPNINRALTLLYTKCDEIEETSEKKTVNYTTQSLQTDTSSLLTTESTTTLTTTKVYPVRLEDYQLEREKLEDMVKRLREDAEEIQIQINQTQELANALLINLTEIQLTQTNDSGHWHEYNIQLIETQKQNQNEHDEWKGVVKLFILSVLGLFSAFSFLTCFGIIQIKRQVQETKSLVTSSLNKKTDVEIFNITEAQTEFVEYGDHTHLIN